jgi:hypothetical protein
MSTKESKESKEELHPLDDPDFDFITYLTPKITRSERINHLLRIKDGCYDISRWVEEGHKVVLMSNTRFSRVFHRCDQIEGNKVNRLLVKLNMTNNQDLLHPSQIPDMIRSDGYPYGLCDCPPPATFRVSLTMNT